MQLTVKRSTKWYMVKSSASRVVVETSDGKCRRFSGWFAVDIYTAQLEGMGYVAR